MACIKKKTVTLELLVKENQLGAVSQWLKKVFLSYINYVCKKIFWNAVLLSQIGGKNLKIMHLLK
jgi:hypothetical protein